MVMGNLKICMYLFTRFYSNHKNLMLAKYTCFIVIGAEQSADYWPTLINTKTYFAVLCKLFN